MQTLFHFKGALYIFFNHTKFKIKVHHGYNRVRSIMELLEIGKLYLCQCFFASGILFFEENATLDRLQCNDPIYMHCHWQMSQMSYMHVCRYS